MEKLLLILLVAGVVVQAAQVVQVVVPQGIESVNGSNVTMGCTSPLEDSGDGVMVCSSACSTLLDGVSPTIDTSTSDWASQLVTVRKTDHTDDIEFPHVLLTFCFDKSVTVTRIELDLFLCPELNIGAPVINVYANRESNLNFSESLPSTNFKPSDSKLSCDSLLTVTITLRDVLTQSSFLTWHILVSQFGDAEWAHIGEVRFLGAKVIPNSVKCTVESSTVTSTPTISSSPMETSSLSLSSPPSPVSTTATSNSPTGKEPSVEDNTVLIVSVVVVFVGVTLIVIALIFIFCFIWRRFSRRHTLSAKAVQAMSYELKEQQKHSTDHPLGNPVSATNPISSIDNNSRYFCRDVPVDPDSGYDVIKKELIERTEDALYDMVATDETPVPVPAAATQTATRDDDDTGLYEIIPLTRTVSLPVQTSVQQEQQSPTSTVDNRSDLSGRVYSVVHKKAPTVPKKSLDLEEYLTTRSAFNENIYSESINPSDFTQQAEMGEMGSDPMIYTPIYPAPNALPESFEQPVEVTIDNIKEKRPLRTGQFGEVVKAATKGLSLKDMHLSKTDDSKEMSVTVAVKKLKPHPTPTQQRAFDVEAKFMSRLRHPNVIRLLGVCYQEPAFIMMEYMREGDLSQFLRKYSEIVSLPATDAQIAASTLVYMASQIASGMKQLAALNFVHRDLATRNCLVGENYTVKIADLGVNKNIYQSHYFRVQGYILLPIRWMATECFNGKFSEKSDVWAFGVTMWELFTLAKDVPYPHLSDEEVIHNALKREYRLFPSRAAACPQPVYKIMEQCWIIDLKQRATFKKLHTMLQQTSL